MVIVQLKRFAVLKASASNTVVRSGMTRKNLLVEFDSGDLRPLGRGTTAEIGNKRFASALTDYLKGGSL